MKKNSFFTAIGLITAVWFSACTQDETMDDNTLPEGKYPLEIASVTMSVESSERPWNANAPQTRVAENTTDGNSSTWEWNGSEKIGVQLYADGETATYTLNSDNTLTPDKTLYWKNTQQTTVNAWYPTDATVNLADQSKQLAYVLTGSGTGNYNSNVTLNFSHALAKVRVVLNGTDKENVTGVKIKSYTSCTNKQGSISTDDASEGWITMMECTRDGATCWEANVVSDHTIMEYQVNDIVSATLEGGGINPLAAKVNTITLTVGKEIQEVTPSDENRTINFEDGDVVNITGDGTEKKGKFIFNISEGKTATVNLNNVYLKGDNTTNGSRAIDINGGGTIIFKLNGTENTVDGYYYPIRGHWEETAASIHIIGPGTLNITGENVCGAIVTDKKKNIQIENVTLNLDYKYHSGAYSGAAIGSGSVEECGNITIINSDISIKANLAWKDGSGRWYGAAIGAGSSGPTTGGKCGTIDITLKEGQTKADFLSKITVTNTLYNNETLSDEQKVGKGRDGYSSGTVTWLNSDGTPAE